RPQFDHSHVAALGEIALLVKHIGDAARHAGGEVAPRFADNDDDAASHVFAAMVADAFDDGDDAGIAHREALAGDTGEIGLALGGAIGHRVADDDRFGSYDVGLFRRADDDEAAHHALAELAVGGADQL